tara:strand:- start:229 stop:483 length:255 start_codon:yes stop_codon:yes gene_type:complete
MIGNKSKNNRSSKLSMSKKFKKISSHKLKNIVDKSIDTTKASLTKLIDTYGVQKGLKIWRKNYKETHNSDASMCQIGAALLQSQ